MHTLAVVQDLARVYHYYLHGLHGTKDLPEKEIDEDDGDSDDSSEQDSDDEVGASSAKKRGKSSSQKQSTPKKPKHSCSSAEEAELDSVNNKLIITIFAVKGVNVEYRKSLKDVSSVEVRLMRAQVYMTYL